MELLCADAVGVGLMKGKVVVQPSKRKVSLELYIVEILKKNFRDDEVIDVVYVSLALYYYSQLKAFFTTTEEHRR